MKSFLDNLSILLMIGIVVTIPTNLNLYFSNGKLTNLFVILLLGVSIWSFILRKENVRQNFAKLLPFLVIFFIYVVGLLWSDNLKAGVREVFEKKFAIVAIPICFFLLTPKYSAVKKILLSYAIACVLISVYCFLVAFFEFHSGITTSIKSYHELGDIVGVHPIYLALFYSFAIYVFIYYSQNFKNYSFTLKIGIVSSIACLIASIIMLSARLHIALLAVVSIIALFVYFKEKSGAIVGVAKASLVGVLIVAIALSYPPNLERFKQAINYKNQYGVDRVWGEQQMRPLMWNCAFELISASPLLGYGTGDVQDELDSCYIKNNYTTILFFSEVNFNAHNQFLEIVLETGSLSLLIIAAIFVFYLSRAFKEQDWIYFSFLSLFLISCMTESYLERHHGIIFFIFFNALFNFCKEEPVSNIH